jgi:hypothetical protein
MVTIWEMRDFFWVLNLFSYDPFLSFGVLRAKECVDGVLSSGIVRSGDMQSACDGS